MSILETKSILKNNIPKITVVTVVYNGEKVIKDTIESVLGQNYSHLEYIVIDGKSTDNTLSIVKQYENKIDILVSEKDSGVYDAMNKGIDLASGDWILFMNAGDRFYNRSTISDFFSKISNLDDSFSALYGDAEFRLRNIAYIVEANSQITSSEYMPFSHQAVFTKTSIAKEKKFDLEYKIAADTAFFLRLVKENYRFLHVPVTVCSYDALEGLSVNNEVKRCKEIVALQAKWNNINPKDPYFKKYIRNAYIKQWIRKFTLTFLWVRIRENTISKKHKTVYKIGQTDKL